MEWEGEFVFDLNAEVKKYNRENILSFEVRSFLNWSRDLQDGPPIRWFQSCSFPNSPHFAS